MLTLRNLKTKIKLQNQEAYEIPCKECDKTYIGQTNRRVNARSDQNPVRKMDTKSFLPEHVKNNFHTIDFDNTKMLDNEKHRTMSREPIKIEQPKHYG